MLYGLSLRHYSHLSICYSSLIKNKLLFTHYTTHNEKSDQNRL